MRRAPAAVSIARHASLLTRRCTLRHLPLLLLAQRKPSGAHQVLPLGVPSATRLTTHLLAPRYGTNNHKVAVAAAMEKQQNLCFSITSQRCLSSLGCCSLRSCRCRPWVAGPSHRYRQAVASEAGSRCQVWRCIVTPACWPCSASILLHNVTFPPTPHPCCPGT